LKTGLGGSRRGSLIALLRYARTSLLPTIDDLKLAISIKSSEIETPVFLSGGKKKANKRLVFGLVFGLIIVVFINLPFVTVRNFSPCQPHPKN
jgi:hypothetical protein